MALSCYRHSADFMVSLGQAILPKIQKEEVNGCFNCGGESRWQVCIFIFEGTSS